MILVTGSTGFLGSYLVKYLVQQGKSVRILVRPTSDLSVLENYIDKVDIAEGDVLDVISLERAMEDVSQVYHVAAMVSFDSRKRDQLYKVNVEGTANMVNIALDNKVEKFLHVSSVAAIGRPEGIHNIDETLKWEKSTANTHYGISKFLAEKEVWRGTAEGLNAVIVNPSVILGAGKWDTGTAKIFNKINSGFPFYATGISGFVDVRDVAVASIRLMESNNTKERFIVSAENKSYQDLFFEIADALGVKRPFIKAHPLMMRLVQPFEKLKCMITGEEPAITRETVQTALRTSYYDNNKVKEAIGFKFRPLDDTILDTAALLKESSRDGRSFATLPL